MKIHTRAVWFGWVALVSIVILVAVNAFALLRQSEIDDRLRGVHHALSDLRFVDELAAEILQAPNQRTAEQWERLIGRLDERLVQLFVQLEISEGFQNEIRGRLNAIDRAIRRLNDPGQTLNAAVKKTLVGRLSANRNALFTQIERLQSELADRRSQLIETTGLVIAFSILIVAAVVIAAAISFRRTVLIAFDEIGGAVDKLKPGVTTPIETSRSDEIGDMLLRMEAARKILTRAFERETASRLAAEELSRAKSAFIATTSHELRTPLNGLLGSLSFLAQTDLSQEQLKYAKMAKSSGDALLAVINDVLDFSRIESGGIQFEHVAFLPTQVLSDFASMYAHLAEQKGLSYRVDIDLDADLALYGDPGRLRQILTNLIGNALKFTDSGSVRVRASQDKTRIGALKGLVIEVTDTGIGIPKEKIRAIFDPFAQADGSTSRRFGGSGLGLSISAKLAEAMGGKLTVESDVGVGSTFRLALSLRAAKREDVLSIANVISGSETEFTSLRGLQVLVVDDVEINRIIASDMLRKWGCLVSEAIDGRKALDALDKYTFDVVLMDVQMPEMDGLTATRKARELGYDLPIIGMTANAFKEQRDEYLAGGMNEVVSKPVDWQQLLNSLQRHCKTALNRDLSAVEGAMQDRTETVAMHRTTPAPPPSAPDNEANGEPVSDPDGPPVLETAILDSLREIMPPEKLESLTQRAIAQVHEAIRTLRAPHTPAERAQIAHSIKGMCGNLGFSAIAKVSLDLEREVNESKIPEHLDRLDQAVARTQQEFAVGSS